MKKILIATHGNYAQGALSAANIIIGEKEHVHTINAYTKDIVLKDEIERYFTQVGNDDTVIVLTDMFGGSVNQALMPYVTNSHVYLITGFNLALLLEILLLEENAIEDDTLRKLVSDSQKQVLYVNDVLKQKTEDDFDL